MNSDIDPDDAINKIIAFSNQIDALSKVTYNEGEAVKTQLNTRIKAFVQTAFKDDDKKIKAYDIEINKNHRVFVAGTESEETKQKRYQKDLEIMRNHLIGYKDELELISNSRKKKNQQPLRESSKDSEPKKYSLAEIYYVGIGGLVGFVIFAAITYTTYTQAPNIISISFFGVISLVLGILGVGCFVKPDDFGPILMLLFKNIGKNNSTDQGKIDQRQKNPKNSPQIVNYGNLHYEPKSNESDEEEER
jgi:hypothetical protein